MSEVQEVQMLSPASRATALSEAIQAELGLVADSCRVLGALFYWPSCHPNVVPMLEAAKAGTLTECWPFGDTAELARLGQAMQSGLQGEDALSVLKAEQQRLFFGPDHLEAPPWGSVYREEEGTLFGDTTQALTDFLSAEGVMVSTGQEEPEDHIGLLFWALAWFAEAGRPDAIRTLLREHILPWSGQYLDRLNGATSHPFFQSLAGLASMTLAAVDTRVSQMA
jgi:putative dimethyl sulfoxide reductase chaperone